MPTDTHEELRPLAFSIAYRMVGSVGDAEDLVQEALMRVYDAEEAGEQRAETSDSLSQAFLVLLEQLSPVERAAFLLREVFGYDYEEIARVVQRSQDNCRQLLVRARRHVEAGRPRFDTDSDKRAELAERFLRAAAEGDMDALVSLLAADAAAYGDGGGKVSAARKPVHGAQRVAKFIAGIVRVGQRQGGYSVRPAWVNHQPGFVITAPDGGVDAVWALDVADGLIQSVRIVRNPDKLGHVA